MIILIMKIYDKKNIIDERKYVMSFISLDLLMKS